MSASDIPLPYGWIKQSHPDSGHVFYVDTKANPPRSIWVHPYEDEQFLREHPDIRAKVRPDGGGSLQVPKDEQSRRHSYNGRESSPMPYSASASASSISVDKPKRSFLGKIKDKAVGTKEEREAEKIRRAKLHEQQRKQLIAAQAAYGQQSVYGRQQFGGPQSGRMGMGGMGMGGMGMGGMGGMGMGGMGGMGMGGMGMGGRRTGMGGMGGMGLPLVGGLAGGLILGDMLDGGLNDHDYGGGGDYGGDYGGGDFGGGDFGGGGGDF